MENPALCAEGFGGAGEERTMDNGEAVDTTGDLKGFMTASGAPITFNGAREPRTSSRATIRRGPFCRTTTATLAACRAASTSAPSHAEPRLRQRDLEMPELFVSGAADRSRHDVRRRH
jgi:hypothetical protein